LTPPPALGYVTKSTLPPDVKSKAYGHPIAEFSTLKDAREFMNHIGYPRGCEWHNKKLFIHDRLNNTYIMSLHFECSPNKEYEVGRIGKILDWNIQMEKGEI
jgi:hypothetical protein